MIDRRLFAALAAVIIVLLAALGLLAWRAWDTGGEGSLTEALAVKATLGPQQHMFGDPLRARVEVIVDEEQVDPESVRLRANFAPYRPLRPRTVTRSTSGGITRLGFDYQLACLTYRCLPGGQRRFELRNATVQYRTRDGAAAQTEEIDWPTLQATGRISRTRFWEAQMRSEFTDVGAPTYRVSPRVVELIALALALLFAGGAAILILRLLPLARLAERLGLKTVDRRTPLERALARVQETATTADRPEEGRRALERLAHELRAARSPELARAASGLAWSRQFPADGRLTVLTGEVTRLIRERA